MLLDCGVSTGGLSGSRSIPRPKLGVRFGQPFDDVREGLVALSDSGLSGHNVVVEWWNFEVGEAMLPIVIVAVNDCVN